MWGSGTEYADLATTLAFDLDGRMNKIALKEQFPARAFMVFQFAVFHKHEE